jgi:hypothetical protein
MIPLIVAFLVVDVIVLALVFRDRLRLAAKKNPLLDLGKLSRFARIAHERVGEHMRANWSGDSATLAAAMPGLVEALERAARAEGLELERNVLLTLARQSLLDHGLTRKRELDAACAALDEMELRKAG